jgi:two-component system nitrate/nitrite response regulator NarL
MADAIQSLKAQYPNARIVVLTDNFDLNAMMSALQAGVDGYCLATIGCDALIKYLDLVMLGEVVFPSAIFLSALSEADKASSVHHSDSAEDARPLQTTRLAEAANLPGRTLSSREAEILRCLTQGAPNKVIARKLDVAEATVKVHIKAILRKIRVSNRTQAAMWAVAHLSTTGPGDSLTSGR